MKINREDLNIACLSLGYVTMTKIQTLIYDQDLINGEKSRLVFFVALALCTLLVPSYVTLAGTRLSIFTSYACHIFFVSIYLWTNPKLLLISSAFLGLGTALVFVAQGKCLVENKNPENIRKHIWKFWFSFEMIYVTQELAVQFLKKIINNIENVPESCVKMTSIIFVVFSFSLFLLFFQEQTNKYTSGGVECIPSGKIIEHEEAHNKGPLVDLWIPFKNIFQLAISLKMLPIYVIVTFTGLLSISPSEFVHYTPVSSGELWGILFYSFCIFRKKNSLIITFVGYMFLFVFVSISSTMREVTYSNEYLDTNNITNKSSKFLFCFFGIMEDTSIGFAKVCFHAQIYYLVGILFPKTYASAISLVGLFYFSGRLFAQDYHHHWFYLLPKKGLLPFGIFALIGIAVIQHFYLDKMLNSDKCEKALKIENPKLKIFKTSKTISPEIKMVYAGFNNNDTEQLSHVEVENTNEKIKNTQR